MSRGEFNRSRNLVQVVMDFCYSLLLDSELGFPVAPPSQHCQILMNQRTLTLSILGKTLIVELVR